MRDYLRRRFAGERPPLRGPDRRGRQDFECILDHLETHEVADAPERVDDIISSLDILEQNPLIRRPVRGELRELIIGHHSRGYVALYRYVPELDAVFVLAIRNQSHHEMSNVTLDPFHRH